MTEKWVQPNWKNGQGLDKEKNSQIPKPEQERIAFGSLFNLYFHHRKYKKMEELLSKMPHLDCINFLQVFDWGALVHTAVEQSDMRAVRFLLKHGADLNLQTEKSKYTPLMLAAMNADEKMIRFLLKNGANPDLKDVDGKTAMDMLEEKVVREQSDLEWHRRALERGEQTLQQAVKVRRYMQKNLRDKIISDNAKQNG